MLLQGLSQAVGRTSDPWYYPWIPCLVYHLPAPTHSHFFPTFPMTMERLAYELSHKAFIILLNLC